MDRLFNAHVSLIYEDELRKATVNSLIARRTEFWWNPKRPAESTLWKSKIELSEDLFNEIIQHPVPLDMNTLAALKRSSLGLDLYLWLTPTGPSPSALRYGSPGGRCTASSEWTRPAASDKRTVQNFRCEVLRELKKIKLAWPGLNYTTALGLLILHPSTPTITPIGQAQLTS